MIYKASKQFLFLETLGHKFLLQIINCSVGVLFAFFQALIVLFDLRFHFRSDKFLHLREYLLFFGLFVHFFLFAIHFFFLVFFLLLFFLCHEIFTGLHEQVLFTGLLLGRERGIIFLFFYGFFLFIGSFFLEFRQESKFKKLPIPVFVFESVIFLKFAFNH